MADKPGEVIISGKLSADKTTEPTPKKSEGQRLLDVLRERLSGLGIPAAAIKHAACAELAALDTEMRNQAIAEQASEALRTQAGLALLLKRMPDGEEVDRSFWGLANMDYQESRKE